MSDETLEKFIEELNSQSLKNLDSIQKLSITVDLAHFAPEPSIDSETLVDSTKNLYFIKNNEGEYVGAVYVMPTDLHWFILPAHRKKGYLTTALTDTILPDLFSGRGEIRITIDKDAFDNNGLFKNSESVATTVGFINSGGSEYHLYKSNFYSNSQHQH